MGKKKGFFSLKNPPKKYPEKKDPFQRKKRKSAKKIINASSTTKSSAQPRHPRADGAVMGRRRAASPVLATLRAAVP